jgi:hypothetical protein
MDSVCIWRQDSGYGLRQGKMFKVDLGGWGRLVQILEYLVPPIPGDFR